MIYCLDNTHAIFRKLSHWIPLAISLRIPSSVMLLFLRLMKGRYEALKDLEA